MMKMMENQNQKSPEHRIKASLYALGIPILQGATSTIIGVIGLAFAPSYLFVTFFKMIFLVIMLGAFHGMVLLPVLLSLMGPGSCTKAGDQGSTSTGKKSSIRSSGLSTPTLNAITFNQSHRDLKSIESQDSCYTVNMGYVSHDEPSQFVPYQYHQYLQRHQTNYSMQVQPQMDTVNNSTTEQSSPSTSSSSSSSQKRDMNHRRQQHKMHYHHRRHQHHGGQHPQLHHGGHGVGGHGVGPHHHTHNHKGHKHNNHKKHHAHTHHNGPTKVQVHPVQMMEALSAYNNSVAPVDFVIKENVIAAHAHANNNAAVAQQQRESEHNRQLELHLAAISRMQQRSSQKASHNYKHKKVGRSRSHHPHISDASNMVSTVPEGGQIIMGIPASNFAEKPVLRKHHSFPYEMFNNETSYSSDDSLRN